MKRTFFVAGLGIAVLLGGALMVVAQLTDPHPPALPDAPATAAAPAPAAPAPAAPAAHLAPSLPAAPKSGARPARVAWDAAVPDPAAPPMADRVTRKAVRKALLAAPIQSRLARCVDRDVGFFGGATPGRPPRPAPAVLMLELEARGGEARVVDAKVREWGGASEEVVSCARKVLRGQVIAASTPRAGERMWMPFPLNPRSDAVASTR